MANCNYYLIKCLQMQCLNPGQLSIDTYIKVISYSRQLHSYNFLICCLICLRDSILTYCVCHLQIFRRYHDKKHKMWEIIILFHLRNNILYDITQFIYRLILKVIRRRVLIKTFFGIAIKISCITPIYIVKNEIWTQ